MPPGREAVSRAEVILLAVAPFFDRAPSIKSDLANSFSEQPVSSAKFIINYNM